MNTNWLDERIRLGEVPPHAKTEAGRRSASAEGASALESLAESDADLLRRIPPERFAAKLRERGLERFAAKLQARREASSGRTFRWPRLGIAALATASVVFLALAVSNRTDEPAMSDPVLGAAPRVPGSDSSPAPALSTTSDSSAREIAFAEPSGTDDGIRFRGDQILSILVVVPEGAAPIGPEGLVAGSVLRIVAPFAKHAAVYSLDETGMVHRHWPLSGDSAATLPAGPLPRDWETDPTRGWERFVLVTHRDPFSLKPIEAQLRGLRASGDPAHRRISLPGNLSVTDTLLERSVP